MCSIYFLDLYIKYDFKNFKKGLMARSVSTLLNEHIQSCGISMHIFSVQTPSICVLMVLFFFEIVKLTQHVLSLSWTFLWSTTLKFAVIQYNLPLKYVLENVD